ncbi:MAG: hypothetical protein KAU20_05820 [Nanoarchaeota archaeon]|nr:hypothetical protein [Nanoarchaeota archaeon]
MMLPRIILFIIGVGLIMSSTYYGLYFGIIDIINGFQGGIAEEVASGFVTLFYFPFAFLLGFICVMSSIVPRN